MDKFTIFAEGLNIPSGIAVGHGGVWVANSPDLLFLQDTDGDGRADKQEVVVTGFGRDDTHELPNSLTWGPDGWLYGLNGVFNPSVVKSNKPSLLKSSRPTAIHFALPRRGSLSNTVGRPSGSDRLTISPAGL
jgi:glucose/arabinose dehydrogenase